MSLKGKEVSAEDLYLFLLGLPFEYDKSTTDELENAKTLEDIFIALEKNFSFWDHEIFQYLIEEYDLDENHKKLQYAKHFESYIQEHNVSQFVEINPSLANHKAESRDSKKLTLKFDVNTVHCSLAKVRELKETVATLLNVKSSTLRLLSIQEGCMEVTFYIPANKADTIFTSNWKQVSDRAEQLENVSVMSITCNDVTFNTKERKLRATPSKEQMGKAVELTTPGKFRGRMIQSSDRQILY